jgi:hypothetical protein
MIIWQPRILAWFTERDFQKLPYPERYRGKTPAQVFRDLQCSDRLYHFNACVAYVEDERVRFSVNAIDETTQELVWDTPVGKQVEIRQGSPTTWYFKTLKHSISTEEDMRIAIWRNEHATFRWDEDHYQAMMKEVGDLGLPTVFMPRPTVQDLYINTMGVEAGVLAIYDYTDTVEAYFRSLDDLHDRYMDVLCPSPIEIVNFGDNIHAGTLSPSLFEEYVLPTYQRRCERLHRAGKFLHAHWDGDTKSLLRYAQRTGLDGIEAITPVPQGDVTLEEAKAGLGDDMFLLDGIPAILFDEHWPVETLVECAERCIELFAPKLVLGISDEIAYTGDLERVRLVREIVDDYNAGVARKNNLDWFLDHPKKPRPQA